MKRCKPGDFAQIKALAEVPTRLRGMFCFVVETCDGYEYSNREPLEEENDWIIELCVGGFRACPDKVLTPLPGDSDKVEESTETNRHRFA